MQKHLIYIFNLGRPAKFKQKVLCGSEPLSSHFMSSGFPPTGVVPIFFSFFLLFFFCFVVVPNYFRIISESYPNHEFLTSPNRTRIIDLSLWFLPGPCIIFNIRTSRSKNFHKFWIYDITTYILKYQNVCRIKFSFAVYNIRKF